MGRFGRFVVLRNGASVTSMFFSLMSIFHSLISMHDLYFVRSVLLWCDALKPFQSRRCSCNHANIIVVKDRPESKWSISNKTFADLGYKFLN